MGTSIFADAQSATTERNKNKQKKDNNNKLKMNEWKKKLLIAHH